MLTRILVGFFSTLVLQVFFSSFSFANSSVIKEDESDSAILYKGPTKVVRPHKFGKDIDYPDSALLFGFSNQLFDSRLFSNIFDNQVLSGYLSVTSQVFPSYHGLQLYQFEKEVIEAAKAKLEELRPTSRMIAGRLVFEVESKGPDRNRLFILFPSENSISISSDVDYFRDAYLGKALAVDESGKIRTEDLLAHFNDMTPNSYEAFRVFRLNTPLMSNKLLKSIRAVRFQRSGKLSGKPYQLEVFTYKDDMCDAKTIEPSFDDYGLPKQTITRVAPSKFQLTVHTSDVLFFYGRLHLLLTVGYNDTDS